MIRRHHSLLVALLVTTGCSAYSGGRTGALFLLVAPFAFAAYFFTNFSD